MFERYGEWQKDHFKGNNHYFVLLPWQILGLVLPDIDFFQQKLELGILCEKRLTVLAFYS